MLIVYLTITVVGYQARGAATPSFLPDALEDRGVKIAIGVLLAFHVLVGYLVTGQPLHRFYHQVFFPRTVDENSTRAALHWLAITTGQLVFGFVVANSIPSFEDFQNLLGSLTGGAPLDADAASAI